MKTYTPTSSVDTAYIAANIDSSFAYEGPGIYRFEIVDQTRISYTEYLGDVLSTEVMEVADITASYLTPQEDSTAFNASCWSREEANYYSIGIPYGIEHKLFLVV